MSDLIKSLRHFFCVFSLFTLLLLIFSQGAVAKPTYRPFMGKWELQTADGHWGYMSINKKQSKGRVTLVGLPSFNVKLTKVNKAGTVMRVSSFGIQEFTVKGKMLVDTPSYRVIAGSWKIKYHYVPPKPDESVDFAGIAVLGGNPNTDRIAHAVLKIEPGGKRVARVVKAGKSYVIRTTVINKGKAGIPNGKVKLVLTVPDTITPVTIVASKNVTGCITSHHAATNQRISYCSVKSLGPGEAKQASFKVKVTPPASSFPDGGKFTAKTFLDVSTQAGLITVKSVLQKMRVRVKASSSSGGDDGGGSGDGLPDYDCYVGCFGTGKCIPGEGLYGCCSRCTAKCNYEQYVNCDKWL